MTLSYSMLMSFTPPCRPTIAVSLPELSFIVALLPSQHTLWEEDGWADNCRGRCNQPLEGIKVRQGWGKGRKNVPRLGSYRDAPAASGARCHCHDRTRPARSFAHSREI